MLFSGIPFLYYFLPAVVAVYFLMPKGGKNGVLLAASLLFYGWGEPKYLLLMLVSIGVFYLCGLQIEKAAERKRKKLWLILSVAFGAACLVVFKYADFFLGSFAALTGLSVPMLRLALPIGISFYTFQCISYTVDVYRGHVPAQKSLVNFGTYVALFPQLIAGPIVRYVDIAKELEDRSTGAEDLLCGVRRFVLGLSKKVLLANQFGLLTEVFRSSTEKSVLFHWLYALGFLLHIYFDFSGYSDMAIGLGRIFGFRFPENFNYPYLSRSITEFWRRWHMTLGGWFRDYVYIPMGGNRVSRLRWVGNILTVWALTGLWHGASWNFVLWGLLFAAFLLMEKQLPGIRQLPGWVLHIYVLLVVTLSFVLFNAADLHQAASDLKGLFGGVPLCSAQALYALRSYGLLFVIGAVGATPLPKTLSRKLPEKLRTILTFLVLPVLLLLCTGYLVDGSFNPFLYFRF